MRNFRKLEVWNDAVSLVTDIYDMLKKFPISERNALADQMRRSAVSIASNIAEGASRTSDREFLRFLEISTGSAFELETQTIIAYNLKYIDKSQLNNICAKLLSIEKRLNRLITILKAQ